MKIKFLTFLGAVFCFASISASPVEYNLESTESELLWEDSCTLTVTCGDGETVTATGKDCETAGKMVDAGCS